MVRLVLMLVLLGAGLALARHFGTTEPAFAAGFDRPQQRLDEIIILCGIGVAAARLGGGGAWLSGAMAALIAALAAYLTSFGLDLPRSELLIIAALVIVGVTATGGKQLLNALPLIGSLAAIVVGHTLTNAAPSAEPLFVLGFCLGAGLFIIAGSAITHAAKALDAGLAPALGAGIAGVGVYQLLDAFVM